MLKKARFTGPVLFIMLLVPLLSACGEPKTEQTTPVTNTGVGEVNVSLKGNKFAPQEITIVAGSSVKWTNAEASKHTVNADDNAFKSGDMSKDAVFTQKFDTPGTFGYFCEFHGNAGSGMAGKIIVTEAGGGAPTSAVNTPAAITPVDPSTPVAPTEVTPTATIAAPKATATSAPPSAAGSVHFRDDTQKTDQAVIEISSVPARPEGRAQYAWLVNGASGASANLGRVTPDPSGALKLTFSAPGNANLLSLYDAFKLTNEELEVTPSTPSADVVLSGGLPPKALVHIRHLLVSFDPTPNKIGLEVGLVAQVDVLKLHAGYLSDSQAQGNLANVKLHAEHLVNIVEGAKGANFGDLNKDGKVTNPGDGYGLLPGGDQLGYLQGSKDHAELAATAPDATAAIKLHAGHVGITVDNVTGWVTPLRDKALEVLKATDTAGSAALVAEILKLANQARDGVALDDGQVLPVSGSGGALTSYQHAQLMAAIEITQSSNVVTPGQPTAVAPTVAAPTVAAPTTAPTVAPVTVATSTTGGGTPGGSAVTIEMLDFKFGSSPTVKVGTIITWVNKGNAPHTATADDKGFDSGTLRKDQNFSFTVTKAGEIKYYCELHGGPGGKDMAAVIKVEP